VWLWWIRQALAEMGKKIAEALETAEAAGYRIDALLGNSETEEDADEA
jgi:hypothetical protein